VQLHLTHDPPDTLVVVLQDGPAMTRVAVSPAKAGARSLSRALADAVTDGYGECFWPGQPGGQYWWIFRRDAETLETVVLWTRGGASLWEHVFRATDAAAWIRDRVAHELAALGLA
jgi:hypothetical protein